MMKKTLRRESPTKTNVVRVIAPLLVSVQQAATILSTTPWAVRNLIWAHKVPTIRLGKAKLISVRALKEFVEAETRAARLRCETSQSEPGAGSQIGLRVVAGKAVRP